MGWRHKVATRVFIVSAVVGSIVVAVPPVGGGQPVIGDDYEETDQGPGRREVGGRYRWRRGFPDASSKGPKQRGANFFAGGPDDASNTVEASQDVSLTASAASIDSGRVTATVAGFFGGFAVQDDNATLSVAWGDGHGNFVGGPSIGAVSESERKGITGLLKRVGKNRVVPVGARSAHVTLTFYRTASEGPYNDGYADRVSLTLSGV